MISEREFAQDFGAFWRTSLPFLSPLAVERIQLEASVLRDVKSGFARPLSQLSRGKHNDFVAELGFELFARCVSQGESYRSVVRDGDAVDRSARAVRKRLSILREPMRIAAGQRTALVKQAVQVGGRLELYFRRREGLGGLTIQPEFPGCGIFDKCFGDVRGDEALYEIKTVDRNLRSADIRQGLVYCALNHLAGLRPIQTLVILNPRRATEVVLDLEASAERFAGKTVAELFHEVGAFLVEFDEIHRAS